MKKPRIPLLAVLTFVFAAFILGFFAGRNLNRAPVQVQALPVRSEMPAQTADTEPVPASTEASGPININTATAQQLQTLPGIGEVLAQRIIDYRETHGDFKSIGALTNVSGIGEKRLEALWDLVTIGG